MCHHPRLRFVEEKFLGMRCRVIAAHFMDAQIVALFDLTLQDDEIKVVEERHYRLVPAKQDRPENDRPRIQAWMVSAEYSSLDCCG